MRQLPLCGWVYNRFIAQTGPLPAVGPQGSLGLKTMVKLAVVPRVELIPRNCSSQTKVCKASPARRPTAQKSSLAPRLSGLGEVFARASDNFRFPTHVGGF